MFRKGPEQYSKVDLKDFGGHKDEVRYAEYTISCSIALQVGF